MCKYRINRKPDLEPLDRVVDTRPEDFCEFLRPAVVALYDLFDIDRYQKTVDRTIWPVLADKFQQGTPLVAVGTLGLISARGVDKDCLAGDTPVDRGGRTDKFLLGLPLARECLKIKVRADDQRGLSASRRARDYVPRQ